MEPAIIIDKNLLDKLTAEAQASPRLRMHYDLRDTTNDSSQRLLNAIEPGTIIPIHRHTMTSETVICVRGRVEEIVYKEINGRLVKDYSCVLCSRDARFIQVPIGAWHTCKSLESGSVILEFKNTKYDSNTTEELWDKGNPVEING